MKLIKYDIEVDKGQTLSTSELTELLCLSPDSVDWPFALMALQTYIRTHTDFTAKIINRGAALRILTDREAARHNHGRFRGNIRGAIRRFDRNMRVDMSQLNEFERQQHERNLLTESRYVTAIDAARVIRF